MRMRQVNKVVLDASALLAFFQNETGSDVVEEKLPNAVISSVNASEVMYCLFKIGLSIKEASEAILDCVREIVDFNYEQALITAELKIKNKKLGLSFGDCACLALGQQQGLPILTADKVWAKLKISPKITVIR